MHLIHRNHIDIQCSETPFAHLIKDELSGVFEHELYPKIEQLLDRYDVADRVWCIEHLSVEIPSVSKKNWKKELVNNVLFQMEEFLKQHTNTLDSDVDSEIKQSVSISTEKTLQQLLGHYLLKGTLPTNALVQDLNDLFETVHIDLAFSEELRSEFQKEPIALLRWALNIPLAIKTKVYEALGVTLKWEHVWPELKESIEDAFEIAPLDSLHDFGHFVFWIVQFQQEKIRVEARHTWEAMLQHVLSYFQISPQLLIPILKLWKQRSAEKQWSQISETITYIHAYVAEKEGESFHSAEMLETEKDDIEAILEALQGSREETKATATMDQAKYIRNAGLVLLHPFLVPLFQHLGFLEDTKWKSVKLQHRAVLILQYASNFDPEIFESDLVLNKILCGLKPTDTVATEWEVTEEEKEQCESLLQSIITHWAILKDTSVPTLQETFLQRNGKLLEYKEDQYELTVEQKGLDILLDHLPWGIGTIRTPWMQHFLSCYWN